MARRDFEFDRSFDIQVNRLVDKELIGPLADEVRDTAQRLAPVRTGKLRNSIRVVRTSETSADIGSDVFYSKYVELGTTEHPSQAFLRPALYRSVAT